MVNKDNIGIFAATVHTTLPIRTASQGVSFAFTTFSFLSHSLYFNSIAYV